MSDSGKSPQSARVRTRFRPYTGPLCFDVGSHTTKLLTENGQFLTLPTCFIRHISTKAVMAVGERVIKMLGKLPEDVEVVFPVRAGQVVDSVGFSQFVQAIAQEYVASDLLAFLRPVKLKAALLYSSHETQRAVFEKTLRQLSWRVQLQPMSTALWAAVSGQHLFTTQGCVIDIGGMTTKIYLFAEQQLSVSQVVEFGGDDWTMDIIQTLRRECHLEVGWSTAEELKRTALRFTGRQQKHTVQGKDVVSGLPTAKVINDELFLTGSSRLVERVIQSFEEVCQNAQPELVAKVLERGIYLTGGGSLIPGLGAVLQETLKLPVSVAIKPLEDIVRGLAVS